MQPNIIVFLKAKTSVIGYTTGTDVISGIMPAHNVVKTATYYLEGSAVMGDMSNLLDAVSPSGLRSPPGEIPPKLFFQE